MDAKSAQIVPPAHHATKLITGNLLPKLTSANVPPHTINLVINVNHVHLSNTVVNAQLLTNAHYVKVMDISMLIQIMVNAFVKQAGTLTRIKSVKIALKHKKAVSHASQKPTAQFATLLKTGFQTEVGNVFVKLVTGKTETAVKYAQQKFLIAKLANKMVSAQLAKIQESPTHKKLYVYVKITLMKMQPPKCAQLVILQSNVCIVKLNNLTLALNAITLHNIVVQTQYKENAFASQDSLRTITICV